MKNPREMARLNHLIEMIHDDGVKVMKWQWLRTAVAAFIVPFVSILLVTDQPITKNLIVSAVIAGLAAAVRAIDPQVRLSVIQKHLDEAHTMAQFDWTPEHALNLPPAHPLGEPEPPSTPPATSPPQSSS